VESAGRELDGRGGMRGEDKYEGPDRGGEGEGEAEGGRG